jgi:hypothetical protein
MNVTQVGNSTVVTAVGGPESVVAGRVLFYSGPSFGEDLLAPEVVTPPSRSFVASSVAQAGNSSVIAAVGSDGSLWFYWQTIGTVPWNPEVVAAAATSTSSPVTSASVAHVGNSSVIAAAHQDGTLSFYWQTIGAMGWNEELVPGPGPNNVSSVSVAQVGDASAIAAVKEDGSLSIYWQTIGGGPWNPIPVTLVLIDDLLPRSIFVASVAQVGDYLALAAVGYDASLWVYWQTLPLPTPDSGGGGLAENQLLAQPGSVMT